MGGGKIDTGGGSGHGLGGCNVGKLRPSQWSMPSGQHPSSTPLALLKRGAASVPTLDSQPGELERICLPLGSQKCKRAYSYEQPCSCLHGESQPVRREKNESRVRREADMKEREKKSLQGFEPLVLGVLSWSSLTTNFPFSLNYFQFGSCHVDPKEFQEIHLP